MSRSPTHLVHSDLAVSEGAPGISERPTVLKGFPERAVGDE
jgi:hypothetical protein